MNKKKKLLLTALSVALVAIIAVFGTVAYLMDTDSDVNVMTLGNVQIVQHEYERVLNDDGTYEMVTSAKYGEGYKLQEFTQAKPLYPATGAITGWGTKVPFDQIEGASGAQAVFAGLNNVQDKFVLVENTGKSDAYVRTMIALEYGSNTKDIIGISTGDFWTWNGIGIIEVDGNNYYLFEAIYKGSDTRHIGGVLPAGEYTYNSLGQIYLANEATNEDVENLDGNNNGTYDILVFSQACQVDGFADAETALDTAFDNITTTAHPWTGEANKPVIPALVEDADALAEALANGGSAILTENIADAPVTTTAPYGNYYGVALNGGVFDGGGNTLDFSEGEQYNGKLDNYGIMTSGGTIKNVTITGVYRGIMIMSPTEDIYIDNVTIGNEDVCYAINTGEGDGTQDVIVTNSTIKGWNSYGNAVKSVTFTNCTFAQGEYYSNVYGRLVKPYVDTVFENCEFSSKYYIDLSALTTDGEGNVVNPDAKIVLKNCTVNGTKLTAENWTSLIVSESDCGEGQISIEGKDGSYMSATNIFDYVIIE